MIDLGIVNPGETIYIPFGTYAVADGASITMSGLAVTDIEVYKDGSVTQRSDDAGYTLLDTDGIDFDGITGIHGFSINLADNTVAGFWAAGSRYFVVVSSITVDTETVSFVAATFKIGYPGAILNTTIATLASQTSFTLTAGPAEDDALNGSLVLIHDVASAVQKGYAFISDYTGATKTVTLAAGTTFTAAATDNISVFPRVDVSHWLGTVASGTTVRANIIDIAGSTADATTGILNVNVAQISTDSVAADRLETMLDGTGGNTLSLGALTVTGATSLATLATSGTTTLNALVVSTTTTLTGTVAFGGAWTIAGATTWTGDWTLAGTTDMQEGLSLKRTGNRAALNIYQSLTSTGRGAVLIVSQASGIPLIEAEATGGGTPNLWKMTSMGKFLPDDSLSAAAAASDLGTELGTAVWATTTRTLTATGLDLILANSTFAGAMADAVWDETIDGSLTGRQSVRLINSACHGKASGLATATAVYRDVADTKDRITATVDADGNRSAVTRDAT